MDLKRTWTGGLAALVLLVAAGCTSAVETEPEKPWNVEPVVPEDVPTEELHPVPCIETICPERYYEEKIRKFQDDLDNGGDGIPSDDGATPEKDVEPLEDWEEAYYA